MRPKKKKKLSRWFWYAAEDENHRAGEELCSRLSLRRRQNSRHNTWRHLKGIHWTPSISLDGPSCFPLRANSSLLWITALSPEGIVKIHICYICNLYIHLCCAMLSNFSCVWLCDSTDCSLLGSSVHGISQTRILGWVAISFSRGSSWCRDRTCVSYVSCIVCIYILSHSLSLSGFSLLREREYMYPEGVIH